MIGFLRGALPSNQPGLHGLRQETQAKMTIRGYTDPRGPVLKEALPALAAGVLFEDFARSASTILGVRGAVNWPSVEITGDANLGSAVSRTIRAQVAPQGSPYQLIGRPMRAMLLAPDQANEFGASLWRTIEGSVAYPAVKQFVPSLQALAVADMALIEGLTNSMRVGLGKGLPGLTWLAAGSLQPPPVAGPLLLIQFTEDREEAPRVFSSWIDGPLARRLYESRSEAELIAAARQAAIRDSPVDPPSHECLPEAYSLQVSAARQALVDDDTEEMAMEFLLGPLGLLKADARQGTDAVRPLGDPEVAAIKARLEALNALSEHELFSEAGRFLRPGSGSSDDGGYAGELAGDLRERLDKLFASAAKKGEPITLVTCSDWLGSGKV